MEILGLHRNFGNPCKKPWEPKSDRVMHFILKLIGNQRVIKILQDMLRARVMDFKGNWVEHLPLIEFAYNNSFQSSIGMAPYEAL